MNDKERAGQTSPAFLFLGIRIKKSGFNATASAAFPKPHIYLPNLFLLPPHICLA